MKKKLRVKKVGLVFMMSLIVMSVLSVTGYAVTTWQDVKLSLNANTKNGIISGADLTTAYTNEFTYGLSYIGPTTVESTGSVSVKPNTDRGSTAGGNVSAAFQKKQGLVWWTDVKAYGETVVIENVPTSKIYFYDNIPDIPTMTFRKGTTYRGKFEVEYLCAPKDAANVTVHPAIEYYVYLD